MKKPAKTFMIASVTSAAILCGIFLLLPSSHAEARRTLVSNGDIYHVSSVTGAYRFTHSKDVQMLFDDHGNDLLIGKGLEGGIESTAKTDSSRLYLAKNDTGDMTLLTDELVDKAFFDKSGSRAYFVTNKEELRSVDIATKSSRLLKDKVLDPRMSPDGKFMVYTKLSPDWVPGDFYDKALGLAVLNLETGEEKIITDSPHDFDATWTPDGSRIIFLSTVTVQDTTAPTRTASLKDYKAIPDAAFHPAKPEFASKSTGNTVPQPANADGTSREEFTTITLPSTQSTYTTFFSIKPDGTERTQLTPADVLKDKNRKPPVPSSELSWSKDGTTFAYDSDGTVWTGVVDKAAKKLDARRIGAGREPKWDTSSNTITTIPDGNDKSIIRMTPAGQIVK